MIDTVFNSGALPALERLVQFTDQRHHVLVDDIANLSTPNFKPMDLDPAQFQQSLRDAIDHRRDSADPAAGPLEGSAADESSDGSDSGSDNTGILFHDQNNRDVERIMQHLAENTLAHTTGIEFIRDEYQTIKMAIQEHI